MCPGNPLGILSSSSAVEQTISVPTHHKHSWWNWWELLFTEKVTPSWQFPERMGQFPKKFAVQGMKSVTPCPPREGSHTQTQGHVRIKPKLYLQTPNHPGSSSPTPWWEVTALCCVPLTLCLAVFIAVPFYAVPQDKSASAVFGKRRAWLCVALWWCWTLTLLFLTPSMEVGPELEDQVHLLHPVLEVELK